MGNHSTGRMIVQGARLLSERRRPGETAMEILDAVVPAVLEVESSDAEFDDDCQPGTPLGDLISEAFGSRPVEAYRERGDDDWERWYEECYWPFSRKYGLT